MGAPFGQVIGIPSMLNGFLGDVTRVGGGDPFIKSRQSNANNAANISVGDAVVLMPDATNGTVKQFADWIANGGGFSLSTNTASNTTLTPSSTNGLSVGMLVKGTGIPAGAYITAVGATTVTISKAATATANGVTVYYALFYGIAVREVKTNQPFSAYSPTSPGQTMNYAPGEMVDVLLRGGVLVQNLSGVTAMAGWPAYIRTILNAGTYPNDVVGGISPVNDGVNSILLDPNLAQAFFTGGYADANNLIEMCFLSRVQA